MNTMSWANARFRSSSIMALPPYLITTVLPAYVSSQGSASVRIDAFSTRVSRCWRRSVSRGHVEYSAFSLT